MAPGGDLMDRPSRQPARPQLSLGWTLLPLLAGQVVSSCVAGQSNGSVCSISSVQ